jgi:hypothetical protein
MSYQEVTALVITILIVMFTIAITMIFMGVDSAGENTKLANNNTDIADEVVKRSKRFEKKQSGTYYSSPTTTSADLSTEIINNAAISSGISSDYSTTSDYSSGGDSGTMSDYGSGGDFGNYG